MGDAPSGTPSLTEWLGELIDVLRGSTVEQSPYTPSKHGPLVSFDPPADLEEVERYWVDVPYAFVWIGFDPTRNEHRYYVADPTLDDFERELFDTLVSDLRETLIHRQSVGDRDTESVLATELTEQLERYGVDLPASSVHRLFYHLYRRFQGYDRIDPVLKDSAVEDISCDGDGMPVFVYHSDYNDVRTNLTYEESALDDFVVRLAQRAGRNISIGDPITQAMLPDGSRTELALGDEVTPHGSAFTIRKFGEEPMTPATLLEVGTYALEQMAYLWLAIEHNKSLLMAGGTASGKTTSMNAVSMFIPPRSKVITIEDTPEIRLDHENWLSSVTRENVGEEADIGMYKLLRSGLRHRPEYIIVGEVRGGEAVTLFQAMNTGHTTFSTMHADSVQTAINRLENEPINVPRSMIQSLDILSVQVISHRGGDRDRRIRTISEILDVDQRTGDLDYQSVFTWEPATDTFDSRVGQSRVLSDIRDERGWSDVDLERELRDRQRVLDHARRRDLLDYQTFTGLVNEYYADKPAVMARVERADGAAPVRDGA